MFKRRAFLKSAAAALGAISAWFLVPVSSSAKTPDVPPALDLETAICRWSKKSEYPTKRLERLSFATFFRAHYGGAADLRAIQAYVAVYYADNGQFPKGRHVVNCDCCGQSSKVIRKLDVCFPAAWGSSGEPVDFRDPIEWPGLTLEEILDRDALTVQRVG